MAVFGADFQRIAIALRPFPRCRRFVSGLDRAFDSENLGDGRSAGRSQIGLLRVRSLIAARVQREQRKECRCWRVE